MSGDGLRDGNVRLAYHRYVNKLEKEVNVQVGFLLFGIGIALALLALVLFVWSLTLEAYTSTYYTWTRPAYAASLLAVPLVLLGIVVLLPPERRYLGLAAVGLAVALAAIAGFVWIYPDDWYHKGADYTLHVLLPYAGGVGLVAVATATSLKAHAPEIIDTVTEIHRPDPVEESDDAPTNDVESDADGPDADEQDGDGHADELDADEGPTVVSGLDDEAPPEGEAAGEDDVAVDDTEVAADEPAVGVPTEITLVVDGEEYVFGDGDTFGRRDEPWLDDLIAAADGHEEIPYVSSEHVEFSIEDDGAYVTDLSRNGTKLNGRELDGDEARLSDGDRLVFADRAKVHVRF